MQKIAVTKQMHERAMSMCQMEAFNARSIIRDGSNQYTGNIAELAFMQYLDMFLIEYEHVGHRIYDHDFIINGATYDVKAKARNVPCRIDYDAHVNEYQNVFDVDHYVFASVQFDNDVASNCELMSWYPKDKFWAECHMVKAGDNSDGLIEKAESGKMRYGQMYDMFGLVRGMLCN